MSDLRTRTPQGDGNYSVYLKQFINEDNLRTRTPQGDGNDTPLAYFARDAVFDLRTRTPQGDGNPDSIEGIRKMHDQFKNQNPARGRKLRASLAVLALHNHLRTRTPQGDGNDKELTAWRILTASFKNQNPARGRKQGLSLLEGSGTCEHLRTRTPQGDGNTDAQQHKRTAKTI